MTEKGNLVFTPPGEPVAAPHGESLSEGEPTQRQDTSLEEKFKQLADAWKMEKMFTSSMRAMEESEYYQAIVNLGPSVVPLLFRELQREPDYWFTALHAILGEDPVPPADRGDLARMTEHWIVWAKQNGYVP